MPGRRVRAVDDISLTPGRGRDPRPGRRVGLRQDTTASAILQILKPPAEIVAGEIRFRGENIVGKRKEELRRFRWRHISLVFQSAMNALNPVLPVGDQFVRRAAAPTSRCRRGDAPRAADLLELVGIDRHRLRATRTSCRAACASASSSRWPSRSSPS